MTQTTIRLKLVDVLGKGLDDHSVVADIFDQHNINHYQVTIPLNGGTDVAISLQDAPGGGSETADHRRASNLSDDDAQGPERGSVGVLARLSADRRARHRRRPAQHRPRRH